MKHATLATLVLAAACAVVAVPAQAAYRATQVTLSTGGSALDAFMDAQLQVGVDVNTEQTDFQRWKVIGPSIQTGVTIKRIQDFKEIGVYNCSDLPPAAPTLFKIFDDDATLEWFAEVTFNTTLHSLNVKVFDGGHVLQHTYDYASGVNTDNFGYYIKNMDDAIFFTEDKRQLQTDSPQGLVYQGEGGFGSGWWLCFEDTAPGVDAGVESRDFDDTVLFLESISPTPVSKATWASVKARFR